MQIKFALDFDFGYTSISEFVTPGSAFYASPE